MTTAATPKVTGAVQSLQTIELQSRTKATHKFAVQAGQAIQIVVDGQPYTGQKKIKDKVLSFKRTGQSLLLLADDQAQPLLEISGFYAQQEASAPASADTSARSEHASATPVDAQALLQEGSSIRLAAADLGGGASAVSTPAWGILVAQAGSAAATTTTTAVVATAEIAAETAAVSTAATDSGGSMLTAVVAGAVALAVSQRSSTSSHTATPRTYTIDAVFGPMTDSGAGTEITLYKKDGTKLEGVVSYDAKLSKFIFTDKTGYSDVVIVKMVDTDSDPDYIDEATGKAKNADGTYFAVLDASASIDLKISVNPLTTAAANKLGVTDAAIKTTATASEVIATNKAVAKAFNIVDANGSGLDVATAEVKTVIDANGNAVTSGNAYGQALAVFSQAEKATGQTTVQLANAIASALDTSKGTLTQGSAAATAISQGVEGALADKQINHSQAVALQVSALSAIVLDVAASNDAKLTGTETTLSLTVTGSFAQGQTLKLLNGTTAIKFKVGDTSTSADSYTFAVAPSGSVVLSVDKADLSDNMAYSLKAEIGQGTSTVTATGTSNALPVLVDTTGPTFTSANAANVAENVAAGTVIYTAAASDTAIAGKTVGVSYSLKTGGDAAAFNIDATTGAVSLKASPDFEGKPSYSFTVIATDNVGNQTEKVVTLGVTDVNEAPTAVTLSSAASTLAELSGASTNSAVSKVADISVTDDALGTNTITLSGRDSDKFEVVGKALNLKAGVTLDYEARADHQYQVAVNVQDSTVAGSSALSTSYTLNLSDVNEAPTAIALSAHTVAANVVVGAGVEVGTLNVTDPDASGNNNALTVSDTTNFKVDNGKLIFIGSSPDYDTTKSYSVTVNSTDANNGHALVTSQDFTIDVTPGLKVGGALSAGKAMAGITITAYNAAGEAVASAVTDANGQYALKISAQYAGQSLLLKASDTSADGQGYIDEATGESKDFSVSLRAMVQLGTDTTQPQKAQISTATELATRVLGIGDNNSLSVTKAQIQAANTAVSKFLGVSDIVNTDAPDVVGKGDTSNATSDAYGKGLALLSGMDAVVERGGASNATGAALDKLASAFTLDVTGAVATDFNDPELLNLLSQAVTEVAQTQGSGLAQDLAGIALNAVTSQTSNEGNTTLAFFMTSSRNLIGDGKTATLQFHFDSAPKADQITALTSALGTTGGSLGALSQDSSDTSGKTWTATFTQAGTDAPQISVSGTGFYANDLSMVLDNTVPTLSVVRMEGLDGTTGTAKTTVKAGDTLRVTLSASEAVNVSEGGTLQLSIGGQTVNASYNAAQSGTRSLVFEYTVGNNLSDAQGVSVVGLTGATIADMADNAADPSLNGYSGLPVYVDTTPPVVLAQVPIDNSVVGNAGVHSVGLSFGEAVSKGTSGTITLKNSTGGTVATWGAADAIISADERSVSYVLPSSVTTLAAGAYTIEATGSPIADKAGNPISTSALTSDGVWSFTVGAVSIGIDKVGGDNLLNGKDIQSDISFTGSLSGDGSTSVSAADMQVWLQPIGGGTAVQAKVTSLSNGNWSATLAAADAASLKGGYVVKVSIDAVDVQASATSALLVDTQAQITLGAVAGDNLISLVEQAIVNSGKSLSYSFFAEKGSSGSITLQNADTSKKVVKTFSNAQGSALDQVTLSKDDLTTLGAGSFSVVASVTDVAGNTNTVSKAFSIEAPPTPAQISSINLQGSRSGTLIQGDTLTASVNFDKAVTLTNTSALTLNMQVGENTRTASFAGISADRKQLLFTYKVGATDTDGDGVALNGDALKLGTGAAIKDVALGTAATVTSSAVNAVATLQVNGSITDTPADLALNVTEAGLTAANQPTAGNTTARGKLLTGGEITEAKTITKAQFGNNSEVTITAQGAEVEGSYGKWMVKADGTYTYTLNNGNATVNALTKNQTQSETLKFWVGAANTATEATITIQGSNDAPTVSAAITSAKNEGDASYTLNLLQGANDVDTGDAASLAVVPGSITCKVGAGATSSILPAGLTLSGNTLTVDPTHKAFDTLAEGVTQDIVVSYLVKDAQGATVKQSATLTITGTNDAPTLTAALVQDASEGAGLSSINLLQGAKDSDTGDTLSVSNVTYTVAGTATGNSGADLPAGVTLGSDGLLRLDMRHPAYDSMKAGDTKAIAASYTLSDGKGGSVAQTATFTLTGTNDAPQVNTAKALLGATAIAGVSNGISNSFDANAFTDPEGDTLSYSATLADGSALPTWLSFDPGTRSFSGTAPASNTASQLSIQVTASDGSTSPALSASQTFTLAISPTGAPVAVVDKASVTESGIDTSGNAAAGTASATGNFLTNDTHADSAMVSVTAAGVGTAIATTTSLSLVPSSTALILKGLYGSLSLQADGSYTYALDNTAPATQRLKAGQVVSDVFTYLLTDSASQTAQSQLVVQVTGSNDAPVLSTSVTVPTSFTLATGKAFTWTVPTGLFIDPDADTLSLSALQVTGSDSSATTDTLPTWLKFDPVNRTVSGTPPEGIAGTTTVRISASDGKGGSISRDIALNFSLPTAPVAAADANQVVEAGISPTGTAVGQANATGNVLGNDSRAASSFSITSADVGTLTGTTALKPVSANSTASSSATTLTGTYGNLKLGSDGSYSYQLDNAAPAVQALKAGVKVTDTFTYELTDSTGQKARTQLTINVTGSNDAPVLSASNGSTAINQAVTESNTTATPISINLLQGASDVDTGEADTLSVSGLSYKVGTDAVSTTLPAGLTLSSDGKTLSLDPASTAFSSLKSGVTQTITASYSVNDGKGGSAPQTATLTVTGTNDEPTAVGTVNKQTAVKNVDFRLDVSSAFNDVDTGDTATYSLSGTGAAGLSIDANGVITGTYTSTRDALDVTVTRTDGSNAKATQTFSLRVVDKPVIALITPLNVATKSVGKSGDVLDMEVHFSEPVTITGNPTLTLNINGADVTATLKNMVQGNNTVAIFTALVPADNNGNVISIKAIVLPTDASIKGNTSGLDLLQTGVGQSTSDYLVDNAYPEIASSLNLAELSTTGVQLTATDASPLTWSLVDGGTDNALFTPSTTEGSLALSLGQLKPSHALDYETDKKTYTVKVKATDEAGNASTQDVTINLTDVNEAPTALALNNAVTTLQENTNTNSRIKVADTAITDDALGTNTFTLHGTDKASFEIDANALYLRVGTVLNYESGKTQYAVTVKAQDDALTFSTALSQDFSLSVTNVNEAPIASALSTQFIGIGQSWSGFTVPAFTDAENDTLSYTATLDDGSALPSWLSFDSNTRSFSIKDGSSTSSLSATNLSVKVSAYDGNLSTSATFSLNVTADTTPPSASSVPAEAPRSYDRAVLQGTLADTVMLRFSESVKVADIKAAMAQDQIKLQDSNGTLHSLGNGAVLDAYTPSSVLVSGLGSGADGTYTSTYNSATGTSPAVNFANGFGLSSPDNFTANTSATIYTRTASDGTQWYIWQQNGWSSWIVSQSSPVDGKGNALPWFLAGTSSSTDPANRTAVLGVSAWYSKAGALTEGVDPWANATKLSNANIETQGYGRTFLLALGTGSTAQAGDVLVIDKGSVKDVAGNAAGTDVQFTLPADIMRPTVSANTPATLVGMDAQGNVKTDALVIGDKVRVTLNMAEAVSVSTNADPSVSLLLDTFMRHATINRAESLKNGATTSSTLVFDYTVQDGDVDIKGGIQLGAYNRNNSNLTDAAGNRFTPPTDLAEVSNSITVAADKTPPTIAKIYSDDRGVLATSPIADTISFKFNEAMLVDQLEQAFTNGLVKVTSADGTVNRNLGAGVTVEATYPSDMAVAGFSDQANGAYKSLWSSSQGKNVGLPTFNGFSYVSGVNLTPDPTYPVYKHTDSATGQDFYFWRPSGYASYVLTPVNSVTGSDAQTWWSASISQTTVSQDVPREGVLLAADWYSRSGTSTSGTKLSTLPTLEASGGAFTFSLSLGTGSNVQQGDKLVFDKSAVADLAGNSPSADLSIDLPADITRPTFGTATVTGFKNNWDSTTSTSTYTETSDPLVQHDRIRVEIPISDSIKLYHSGGAIGYVTLEIGGQTRYAYLNLQASSSNGSTAWGFSSNKLVYDYYIQAGDSDTQGGITVGVMNRGSVGMYDAANNRPVVLSDVIENTNPLTVVDNTPPSLWVSYASGNTVVLQASDALDAANLPTGAFKVTVNGAEVTVQSVAVSATSASALVLTLDTVATQGQSVQVTYTDPSTDNDAKAVQDLAGNDAASMVYYSIRAINQPTIDYTATSFDKVELAGDTDLRFTIKYTDNVRITDNPRLALTLSDGTTITTVYANYEAFSNQTGGQQVLEFVYRPATGDKGQLSVTALDLNGGTITAYDSAGAVAASTTLSNTSFFTPFTWIYPEDIASSTGDAGNNLLAPWFKTPESTPHQLTSTSATGGEGDRDVLAMTVLLPSSVTSSSAAQAYSLSYNVTDAGVRQVLLKNGSATVDTYTVPADNNWPTGVEQLLFHAVYKDSAGQVQFADLGTVLLTLGTHEYIEPGNPNQRWLQGSLGDDMLNVSGRDTAQRIFIEGEQGDDTIVGHDGIDLIRGGGGNNLISAGKGDDQVVIRHGSDSIDGGEGTDTLRFDLPGQEKKITVDEAGVVHVYSAFGSWNTGGFVPDATGWVERYRLASDYGTDGSNRIAVFDVALGRNVAMTKNMERLQWRLDENSSGRNTNTFKVGAASDDTLSAADVVLAGAGNDTITLSGVWLHANDWRYANRALLIDGGAGRDVLVLDGTSIYGYLNQAFEYQTGNNINASRVIKNIEGLNFTGNNTAYNNVVLSAADITNLYSAGDTSTNVWSEIINSPGKRQFKIDGAVGLNITDTSGWTLQTNTVSYGSVTYKIADHSSGVELILDSRIGISGGLSNGGFSGGPTVPDLTLPTTLSIASDTTNGTITEGNSATTPVTFTVKRSGNAAGTSAVNWNLVSTETDSSDFAPGQATSGTLSFAAGETSQTITVGVQGDTATELNERFGIRLSSATGATLNFAETQVTINNDDGEYLGNGPAPVVTLVRTDSKEFVGPYDSLHFVVELDQAVAVTGTPRLALTLTDPTGAQQPRTVYADFVRYGDANGTLSVQSSMEFVYAFNTPDQIGAGWTYHINALENANGSSIKSVESASINVPADLTLNSVSITSGTWLYTSEVNGTTGTDNNDGMFGFEALLPNAQTVPVPHSLTASAADGGAGDRDVLGIPVLLPVTTLAQAQTYYLNYEVVTDSNGNATARTVKLYQQGNSTAVDSYSVPLSKAVWPTNVEALAYHLKFKDTNGVIQDTDHPNDTIVFWKAGYTATDAVNGDIMRQGSYLSDTIDLSDPALAIATATRTFVRGNQGNDTITGHDGTDVLFGDGGNDVVNAGAGNDMVALGAGADKLDGGAGTDVLAMWVKGQDAKPNLTADGKLQVLSAFGTWGNDTFTTDSSGYQLDWTLDFNGQTGAVLAQHAGSTDVSTSTNFEKMRIYPDQYQLVHGEMTDIFDVLVGASGNDTLVTTTTQGILAGLDGDDMITVNSSGLPVLLGGAGNDTFVFGNTALQAMGSGENNVLHGGAGTDTLRLDSDVSGVHLYRSSEVRDQVLSLEALDLTGSTANGALGNSVTTTAQWLHELTDAGSIRSFTVKGDANDRVNLLTTDNWVVQQVSDQSGYALYQTTYQTETLKLYLANAMAAPVIG